MKRIVREKQEKDIQDIVDKADGILSDRDCREISKIEKRLLLPGKKWFVQQKPGKDLYTLIRPKILLMPMYILALVFIHAKYVRVSAAV